MDTNKMRDLKALAEAANAVTTDVNITMAVGADPGEVKAVQDFLQLAMPKTILALLAEIEQLEARNQAQMRVNASQRKRRKEWVERAGVAEDEAIDAEAQRDQLKAENEELRKDAERLTWLDGHYTNVVEGCGEHAELVAIRWAVEGQCSTVREALDDAMAKEASRDC
ncbi:hypothetical protein H4C81_22620 [Pseudomonas monteilii]|uniref:hypothetical protein n=1 Tax=Pseudomonas monteilii TaxID=76759 RepID=UPI0015F943C3|nr:hypothetical protein [Pseudomonas monteilii]MBA6091643.1 hypothetical protein [Pseudomonas monteilii]MCT8191337.1 hypothetical protein [Pseudomonas monteilii]